MYPQPCVQTANFPDSKSQWEIAMHHGILFCPGITWNPPVEIAWTLSGLPLGGVKSPWYNHTGWLGVKRQFTCLLTYLFLMGNAHTHSNTHTHTHTRNQVAYIYKYPQNSNTNNPDSKLKQKKGTK